MNTMPFERIQVHSTLLERYEPLKVIGRGTFGIAVLVQEKQTGKHYVVKQSNLSQLSSVNKSFVANEAMILSQIKHNFIVSYHQCYIDYGCIFILTKYAHNGDLRQHLQKQFVEKKCYFSEKKILDWFVQICLALKYLHDKNILHRDLKTSNIFLESDYSIRLGDFGICKLLENSTDVTKTGVGTPYYLSPEVCQNMGYGLSSDIWSLGCVLYELLAFKRPFRGNTLHEVVQNITKGIYSPIPEFYNIEIRKLVEKMLQLNPKDRPTIDEILCEPIIIDRILQNLLKGMFQFDIIPKKILALVKQLQNEKLNQNQNQIQNQDGSSQNSQVHQNDKNKGSANKSLPSYYESHSNSNPSSSSIQDDLKNSKKITSILFQPNAKLETRYLLQKEMKIILELIQFLQRDSTSISSKLIPNEMISIGSMMVNVSNISTPESFRLKVESLRFHLERFLGLSTFLDFYYQIEKYETKGKDEEEEIAPWRTNNISQEKQDNLLLVRQFYLFERCSQDLKLISFS